MIMMKTKVEQAVNVSLIIAAVIQMVKPYPRHQFKPRNQTTPILVKPTRRPRGGPEQVRRHFATLDYTL